VVSTVNAHTLREEFKWVALFVAIIWAVFVLDRFLPLENLGLIPRTIGGLPGIVAMPFIHADLSHIIGNTIPLVITMLLLAGSRANSAQIVALIVALSGILLWLFGRSALHIGASGLVFGLISFHVFAGFFERRLISVLIAVLVGFLYSATLLRGVLPFQPGVSWDGHLFGALAGIAVAAVVARLNSRS
jgi:membrane associated rhomboid family serine protease